MAHPTRLRVLRKAKNFSRARLAQLSGVSMRTIQRLENPALSNTTPHWTTVERLAKALQIAPGVLTGELPLPQTGKTPAPPQRVQVNAEIAPKARLAYDLVKSRYGVSATEIINMAPLLFVILAEGSLGWRRKKLEEAGEAIGRLDEMGNEVGYWLFGRATTVALNANTLEDESIAKADIFGDHLFSDSHGTFGDDPFDRSTGNPFAAYLRKLATDLESPGVVEVERDDLNYGSPWLRFPDYDLCNDEIEKVTNDSLNARRALETGRVRLSEIPKELKGDDAGKERAAWLEERLPDIYRDLNEDQPIAKFAKIAATATPTEVKEILKKAAPESGSASRNIGGGEQDGDAR